jgi:hypothetical protein
VLGPTAAPENASRRHTYASGEALESRRCPVCHKRDLEPRQVVCSPRCRTRRWRLRQHEARRGRDAEVRILLEAALTALGGAVIVEPNYRGFRFEVDAVPERDRFNAEVRIRRHGVKEEPHVELVNCWKQTVMAAERAGALWARRWIDSRLYSE